MKKRRFFAILLAAVMLLSMAGCSNNEADPAVSSSSDDANSGSAVDSGTTSVDITISDLETNEYGIPENIPIPEGKKLRIGYLSMTEQNQFNVNMGDALRDVAASYGDAIDLMCTDARSLIPQQLSQAEDMINEGMDAIIVFPIDQEASAPVVSAIDESGIPFVLMNTFTNNKELADVYCGVNDVEAGQIAIQIMAETLGGEGNIYVMEGLLGDPANEYRREGVETEIKNYPNMSIGSMHAADWDRGKAMSLMEDWINSGEDFDGLVCMNDEMAISAILALEAAGRDDVIVIGIDAIEEAQQMVKEGRMHATILQSAEGQGGGAMNLAIALALGLEVEPEYLVPWVAITAENVDDYLS